MQSKWKRQAALESLGNYHSTYELSFKDLPKDGMVFQHYATKKPLSSHFHAHGVNKNLDFRNTKANVAPEYPPTLQQVEKLQPVSSSHSINVCS